MRKAYVVIKSAGQYSDAWSEPIAIFDTKSQAMCCVEQLREEQRLIDEYIQEYEKEMDCGSVYDSEFTEWKEAYSKLCDKFPYSNELDCIPKDYFYYGNYMFNVKSAKHFY